LPEIVISADTTDIFKRRLDKFWQHQGILYDYKVKLTGLGNRGQINITALLHCLRFVAHAGDRAQPSIKRHMPTPITHLCFAFSRFRINQDA